MNQITTLAIKKAVKSVCKYKISAIGFNHKGEIIGSVVNQPRFSKPNGGWHAEALLIGRYGSNLKTIIICRVNKNGGLCPISPCKNCQKLADKYGIKITSIMESPEDKEDYE